MLAIMFICPVCAVAQSSSFSQLVESAHDGNPLSQRELARKYENGDGVERDLDSAIVWYKKSIAGGCNTANALLGALYDRERKQADAYRYFMQYYNDVKKAIDSNGQSKIDRLDPNLFTLSQYKIGEYKLIGFEGVEKDVRGAIPLLKDASSNNYGPIAYLNLANAYKETGDSIEAYNTVIIANDKYHNDMTTAVLAKYYLNGIGCKKDYGKALELLRPSAENGNIIAQLTLGDLFYTKEYNRQNYEEAFKWYSKLAETTNQLYKGTALLNYQNATVSVVVLNRTLTKLRNC